ncbi:hypothetical protein HMPREF0495_01075 [Levilactobacillus brevis ATCC 14869 = DSM 20054]|uniref:Uncharacterized protein n=1 Tax=Levilactobacillus brevis ATCC 14869 = DSM 20054 TaxID=649758 RepID=U2P1E3_LEVBR|nr:hypothetical protein HMPREF0495_01075 [Levilactobacillus brevis ATCC 14869 = DSM 20054]
MRICVPATCCFTTGLIELKALYVQFSGVKQYSTMAAMSVKIML